jgi:predicted metal-dependent hydrolase
VKLNPLTNTQPEMSPFPWPYKLRRSLKAKYLRINLQWGMPIEVVYPKNSNAKQAYQFLLSQQPWIEKNDYYINSLVNQRHELPSTIELPCLNFKKKLIIQKEASRQRVTLQQTNESLILKGPSVEVEEGVLCLRRWLKKTAVNQLEPILHELAEQHNLPFKSVTWRCQKTRWGSCSGQQRINLNIKILFLNSEEARYVMLHELCHTRYLDHGKQFWALLNKVCPQAQMIDQRLYGFDFRRTQWLSIKR